jgi:hypothetical protein
MWSIFPFTGFPLVTCGVYSHFVGVLRVYPPYVQVDADDDESKEEYQFDKWRA